jgi:hypothetical protein
MAMNDATLRPELEKLQRAALMVGAVGLAACAVGFFTARGQFYQSYLLGYVFWIGIALGSFAILLLHHIFGAGWGFVVQRGLEAATRTFPLMAVLLLPLLVNLASGEHSIWSWARPEAAHEPLLQHKLKLYLNVPFFMGRAAFYFAVWIVLAGLFSKWSAQLDESGDARIAERMRVTSFAGLMLYGLTATFAAVDWLMSLEPEWFSTMFGLLFIVGQILATFAFMILLTKMLVQHKPLDEVARAPHFHDLGNLLLAFTMIWAYLAFSQFLIIWSGNQPETITWYKHRSGGGWQFVALGLFLLNFALPFALLLSRFTKRHIQSLARVAVVILAMRLVDLFWVVAPNFHHEFHVHWLDVAAPAGIGGVWLWFFLRELKSRPVLPSRDPRMEGAFAHAEEHG